MILCIGPTPAVQRTMLFDRFTVGEVNRARETLVTASGKGTNVARVLTTLGARARLVQPLGGAPGRYLADALAADGIEAENVWLPDDSPTRTCTTLLAAGGPTTELVEEARPLTDDAVRALEAGALGALPHARALVCSGSLPKGTPDDFYARLVREANRLGYPTIVDAQKAPLKAALAEKPFLVKPNREEAAATLGLTLTGEAETDASTAVGALLDAGAEWALVSMGPAGAVLGGRASGERWRVTPPRVEAVNPIGSGDSLAAGLTYAVVERGLTVPEAVAFGTACAAANCLTPTSGVVRPDDVHRLERAVRLERLG
jgi:tagatose 6-phosphate kinase